MLLLGASGAGKSDLALRLIDDGARLVADDRTILFVAKGALARQGARQHQAACWKCAAWASSSCRCAPHVKIALVVQLGQEGARLPGTEP